MRLQNILPQSLLAASGLAAEFALQISSSAALSNPVLLSASTHGTLSSLSTPLHTARLTPSNTLVFRNVSHGSYLVDIYCATHVFLPLRVDVAEDLGSDGGGRADIQAWDTFRGNDWDNRGEKAPVARDESGRKTFEVKAVVAKNHFIERAKFSVLSILMNPMILIALVSVVLFMGMPYLMNYMDPEMRAEFEERQKSSPMNAILGGGGASSQGNFDMASYLSGSSSADASSGKSKGEESKIKSKGVTR